MPDLQEFIHGVRPNRVETLTKGPTECAARGIMLGDPAAGPGVMSATLHPVRAVVRGR